jgi:hypothetical protein
MGKPYIFNQLCGNPGACLGGIGVGWSIHTRSRSLPPKGASSLWGLLILVMPVSGLNIDLDKLKNEATP